MIFSHLTSFSSAIVSFAITFGGNIPVPPDSNPGDSYQLVFVSSVGRDATSSNLQDYDLHVQQLADLAGIGVTEGVTWSAIGSTESVNARDHAIVSAPVYNMNMEKVADGFADMWDGLLVNAVRYDELGQEVADGDSLVWTGTGPFGVRDTSIGAPLGNDFPQGVATFGDGKSNVNAWLLNGFDPLGTVHRVYGLSSPVIVIPEPATHTLLLVLVGLVATRRLRTVSKGDTAGQVRQARPKNGLRRNLSGS